MKSLSLLGLFLCLVVSADSGHKLRHFMSFPIFAQEKEYTCGPASVRSILHYFGEMTSEEELEKDLKSDPKEGTTFRAIMNLFNTRGYQLRLHHPMTVEQIKDYIRDRKPVLVMYQAWPDKPVKDWKNEWDDGHYSVIIGFDHKNFYFMDPSADGKYGYMAISDFVDRWHDLDENEKWIQPGVAVWKPNAPPYKTFQKIE